MKTKNKFNVRMTIETKPYTFCFKTPEGRDSFMLSFLIKNQNNPDSFIEEVFDGHIEYTPNDKNLDWEDLTVGQLP